MSEGLVSDDPEQEITVKTVEKEDPAAARCGVNLPDNSSKRVDLLIYEHSTATGGKRKLLLDEEGDITVSGYERTLELLNQDKTITYTTAIDRLSYEPESIEMDNLKACSEPNEDIYRELNELVHYVEAEAGFLRYY